MVLCCLDARIACLGADLLYQRVSRHASSIRSIGLIWNQCNLTSAAFAQKADLPGATALERLNRLAQRVDGIGRVLAQREDNIATVQARLGCGATWRNL